MSSRQQAATDVFRRLHRLRMRRDFGVVAEDTSDDEEDIQNVPEAYPEIIEEFTVACREMYKIFGNDPRAARLVETVRSLVEVQEQIPRFSTRRPRKFTQLHSKISQRVLGLLDDELHLYTHMKSSEPTAVVAEIMNQIKSIQIAIVSIEQEINTLEGHASEFSQYIDEIGHSDKTYENYKMLIEKEIDMLIYMKKEFPVEKANLEKAKAKLDGARSTLKPQVTSLRQIQEEYPHLDMIMAGIRDSEATLVQLKNELELRRSELVNLSEVETTLIDELHALRKQKSDNERILNMTEEEYTYEEESIAENRRNRAQELEQEIKNLQSEVIESKTELHDLRKSVIVSYGETAFKNMQQECLILCAKKNLF